MSDIIKQEQNYNVSEAFYVDIQAIIDNARNNAPRSIDFYRV